MKDLEIEEVTFSGDLDHREWMDIRESNCGSLVVCIDKNEAIDIVNHLMAVFDMDFSAVN